MGEGANLTCSALLLALRESKARSGSLPPVLRYNVDGGFKKWNRTVFAFCVHLVTAGVVKEVWLFRMNVGNTHNDQDGQFCRVSVGLHGAGSLDNGTSSLTMEEWLNSVRNSFVDESNKPTMVQMSSVLDFDSFYGPHKALLQGFGATVQYTRQGDEPARMENERLSHTRVALIRMDAGAQVATIRFAQSAQSAADGEWFPAKPPPASTPFAAPEWCSLDGHAGAPVLNTVPDDTPTRRRYFPDEWDKFAAFKATLAKADVEASWPRLAAAACREYLLNPPCALQGVAFDLPALRPQPQVATAPPVRVAGPRRLVVCPLITETRTKAQKAAEVAALGFGANRSYNVAFDQLELGDMAFALAPASAPHAFTLRVCGRLSEKVELLEIAALTTLGPRKARA